MGRDFAERVHLCITQLVLQPQGCCCCLLWPAPSALRCTHADTHARTHARTHTQVMLHCTTRARAHLRERQPRQAVQVPQEVAAQVAHAPTAQLQVLRWQAEHQPGVRCGFKCQLLWRTRAVRSCQAADKHAVAARAAHASTAHSGQVGRRVLNPTLTAPHPAARQMHTHSHSHSHTRTNNP